MVIQTVTVKHNTIPLHTSGFCTKCTYAMSFCARDASVPRLARNWLDTTTNLAVRSGFGDDSSAALAPSAADRLRPPQLFNVCDWVHCQSIVVSTWRNFIRLYMSFLRNIKLKNAPNLQRYALETYAVDRLRKELDER